VESRVTGREGGEGAKVRCQVHWQGWLWNHFFERMGRGPEGSVAASTREKGPGDLGTASYSLRVRKEKYPTHMEGTKKERKRRSTGPMRFG